MPSFAQFGNDLYTGKRSIDFIERRRTWYLIAAVAVLISVGALGINRLNPGIEFRGGSEFTISKVATTDQGLARDAVRAIVPNNEPRISTIGDNSVRVQTDQLSDTETEEVQAALAKAYSVPETQVSSSFVGPSWGADVTNKALTGLAVFLVLVSLVIALYFRTWKMAAAGIVALLHDLLLTILGYSLYDTVVVFDKVRENTEHVLASTKRTYAEAANLAVNQTLVRSINTSVVALLPVASILFIGAFVLGAGTLKDISLALFVGIAAGTYSSIFIATPLLVTLRSREPEIQQQAARVARRRAEQGDRPEEALVSVGAGEDVQEATAATATAASQTGRPAAPAQRQQPRKGTSRGGRPGNRKR